MKLSRDNNSNSVFQGNVWGKYLRIAQCRIKIRLLIFCCLIFIHTVCKRLISLFQQPLGYKKKMWSWAPLAKGQWDFVMAFCLSYVWWCVRPCFIFYFKHLWHYPPDFNKTSCKWSWHGPLQKLIKKFGSYQNSGWQNWKILKKYISLITFFF